MSALRSLARAALGLIQPEAIVHRGAVLPARRFRFGGSHFQEEEIFLASAEREAKRLIDAFGLTRASRLLEIGCGPGRLPIGILHTVGEIEAYRGVDVSETAVRWCQRHIQRRHSMFQFVHLNMQNPRYNPRGQRVEELRLPFPDASFDIAYLYSVFSHLLEHDVRSYLREFARLLRPGGSVFLTAFIEDNVPPVVENPEGYRTAWKGALHCVRYDKAFFTSLLTEYGFIISQMDYATETDGQSALMLTRQHR